MPHFFVVGLWVLLSYSYVSMAIWGAGSSINFCLGKMWILGICLRLLHRYSLVEAAVDFPKSETTRHGLWVAVGPG